MEKALELDRDPEPWGDTPPSILPGGGFPGVSDVQVPPHHCKTLGRTAYLVYGERKMAYKNGLNRFPSPPMFFPYDAW